MKGLVIAKGMADRGSFLSAVRYLMQQNPGVNQRVVRAALKK